MVVDLYKSLRSYKRLLFWWMGGCSANGVFTAGRRRLRYTLQLAAAVFSRFLSLFLRILFYVYGANGDANGGY